LSPLAVGRFFRGLSALPVICPYRAEQATGLAGGLDSPWASSIASQWYSACAE